MVGGEVGKEMRGKFIVGNFTDLVAKNRRENRTEVIEPK